MKRSERSRKTASRRSRKLLAESVAPDIRPLTRTNGRSRRTTTGQFPDDVARRAQREMDRLRRLPSVLRQHQPDLVILCHGGNDMLRKQDRDQTVANLNAMIAMIKESGADVILLGVPEPGIFINTASFYGELAEAHAIPYEGKVIADVLGDASLKSDYIHPNANGYKRIAESVASVISKSQAS